MKKNLLKNVCLTLIYAVLMIFLFQLCTKSQCNYINNDIAIIMQKTFVLKNKEPQNKHILK